MNQDGQIFEAMAPVKVCGGLYDLEVGSSEARDYGIEPGIIFFTAFPLLPIETGNGDVGAFEQQYMETSMLEHSDWSRIPHVLAAEFYDYALRIGYSRDQWTRLMPSNWRVQAHRQRSIYKKEDRSCTFMGFWFEVPHGLEKTLKNNHSFLGLLSAHLQLGWEFNYRNWQKILHRDVSFLPFVITPNHFRFFVFHPTLKNVMKSIEDFKLVLEKVQQIKDLPRVMELVYALVRLDEIKQTKAEAIELAREPLQQELEELLIGHSKAYGFVYQGIKGSQKALDCETIRAGFYTQLVKLGLAKA